MAILRQAVLQNATGAVLTHGLLEDGQDYKLLSIKRILAAADIGEDPGQTQHAGGCLIGSIEGGHMVDILWSKVLRTSDSWQHKIPDLIKEGYQIKHKVSLYIYDIDKKIAADDVVHVGVIIGGV